MTWFGVSLSEEQRDVVDLVRAVVDKLGEDVGRTDVGQARAALAKAGLWTLGVSAEHGGGGAPLPLRLTALAALGQHWTACAWACAQAHAAAEVIGRECPDLLPRLQAADAFAVVDTVSSAVELRVQDGHIRGTLWRVDPAAANPHVIVLVDETTAWVLPPHTVHSIREWRPTGMAGASTFAAEVRADPGDVVVLTAMSVDEVRARLRLAGAAVAAGIALEAAQRSRAYGRSRVQFGAPLTCLPTVRASLLDQAGNGIGALTLALSSGVSSVIAADVLAGNCERAIATATAAVQSHGGYGYLEEYGVERLLRDAVSLRAATGASDGLRFAARAYAGATG